MGAFATDYWGWLLGAAAAGVGTGAIAFSRAPDRWRHASMETVIPVAVALPWLVYSAKLVHEQGFSHRFSFVLVPLAALGILRGLRFALDLLMERRFVRSGVLTTFSCVAVIGLALVAIRPVSATLDVLRSTPPVNPNVVAFSHLGRAIARAGLGEQISFLTGVAGAAPYFAGARHVDPLGLATRELSRVVPLERRKQIIVDTAFDVIEIPLLPASPGAESEEDEPLRSTDYWREVEEIGQNPLKFQLVSDIEEWFEMTHWMMRYLRDNMTLAGVAQQPPGMVRMFVYVSRKSQHYEHPVATLSRELDSPSAQLR